MLCPRCLNRDPEFFYRGSKGWYCRKCVRFSRMLLEEEHRTEEGAAVKEGAYEYLLKYPLTEPQKQTAAECLHSLQSGDVLIKAVCGAGKTELVVPSIADYLSRGKKVGFAIARRQVVLELRERLAHIFPRAEVIAVCGGHTEQLEGDLIIATTHQLYRYYQRFDLLILDEPDAFPFKGDEVLHGIAKTACRGRTVYLTATPDDWLNRMVERGELICLTLNRRPHGHPLPEPVIICGGLPVRLFSLLRWIHLRKDHPRMIFVPTIALTKQLSKLLGVWWKCDACTGETADRDRVIEAFRREKNGLIVTTTVLERGVTIPGADICVFDADHSVFDQAGLVQMAGRAGRSFEFPDGDVLFLASGRTGAMEKACRDLKAANRCAA